MEFICRLFRTCGGLCPPRAPTRIELGHVVDYAETESQLDGSDASGELPYRQPHTPGSPVTRATEAPKQPLLSAGHCSRSSASEDGLYPAPPVAHQQNGCCPPLMEETASAEGEHPSCLSEEPPVAKQRAPTPPSGDTDPSTIPSSILADVPSASSDVPSNAAASAPGASSSVASVASVTDIDAIAVSEASTANTTPATGAATDIAAPSTGSSTSDASDLAPAVAPKAPRPPTVSQRRLAQSEEQQIAKQTNKNRPSEYVWLGQLLVSILTNEMQVSSRCTALSTCQAPRHTKGSTCIYGSHTHILPHPQRPTTAPWGLGDLKM